MKKTLSAAFVVAAIALTGACGGGADRPTKDEVAKSITSKDNAFGTAVPKTAADCVAGTLVDSKLSDEALNAIVENDKDFDGSKEDTKALTDVTSELGKCVTQ